MLDGSVCSRVRLLLIRRDKGADALPAQRVLSVCAYPKAAIDS